MGAQLHETALAAQELSYTQLRFAPKLRVD